MDIVFDQTNLEEKLIDINKTGFIFTSDDELKLYLEKDNYGNTYFVELLMPWNDIFRIGKKYDSKKAAIKAYDIYSTQLEQGYKIHITKKGRVELIK